MSFRQQTLFYLSSTAHLLFLLRDERIALNLTGNVVDLCWMLICAIPQFFLNLQKAARALQQELRRNKMYITLCNSSHILNY